jgi:hypothetical protein
MQAQQELFTEAERPNPERDAKPPENGSAPAPVWLQRLSLTVLVLFCFYIGVLMAVLPWSPRYWDQNGWLLAHPALESLLNRGSVRGIITGIGLIDIWIGISEILHYRDYRR